MRGGSEDPPLPRCDLALAGAPAPLLSFPEGDTDAPQMVVLDGGAAGRPARLAYSAISENANFWHPELRVGELSVGAEWPGGASITREPSLFGFDAHGAGLLVHGPGDTVALTFYHGDEANPNVQARFAFRTVDGASWNLGPEVVVDPAGTISYGLAHGENGYLAAWRADIEPTGDVAPRIALLDEGGQIVAGPVDVAAPEPHPGRAADVAWSGTTYLVATAFDDCEGQPEGCQNRSLVVRRLDETGTLTPASAIAAAAGLVPSRPALGAWGNEVWVAWMEAASDDAPRTIRLAQLDASGAPVGAPRTLSTETRPLLRLGVLVSELGVVVAYPEVGDAPPGVRAGSRAPRRPPRDFPRRRRRARDRAADPEPRARSAGHLGGARSAARRARVLGRAEPDGGEKRDLARALRLPVRVTRSTVGQAGDPPHVRPTGLRAVETLYAGPSACGTIGP